MDKKNLVLLIFYHETFPNPFEVLSLEEAAKKIPGLQILIDEEKKVFTFQKGAEKRVGNIGQELVIEPLPGRDVHRPLPVAVFDKTDIEHLSAMVRTAAQLIKNIYRK